MTRIRRLASKFQQIFSPFLSSFLYPPSGSNCICFHESKILVLDTGKGFRFPGGMVEAKEHPQDTAKRETLEETNLEVNIGHLIEIKPYFKGITGIHFFYKAELDSTIENAEKSWEGKPIMVEIEQLDNEMRELAKKAKESKHYTE